MPIPSRSEKWRHLRVTADGAPRATVRLHALETLWFNTGTLCNIACRNCYIESTPSNDALAYLSASDVETCLTTAAMRHPELHTVGFTGGEPFLNPEACAMIEVALRHGCDALVLTNAMRPMMRPHVRAALAALRDAHGARLRLRVSLDHHSPAQHDAERGDGAFDATLAGLHWLAEEGISWDIAARARAGEAEASIREGFSTMLGAHGLALDCDDPARLVVFPEMDLLQDAPEITDSCWEKVGTRPERQMCATSRMVVKRKGASRPTVLPCTLIAYDPRMDLGPSLADASDEVPLAHPFCAQFCVLGGASCAPD